MEKISFSGNLHRFMQKRSKFKTEIISSRTFKMKKLRLG